MKKFIIAVTGGTVVLVGIAMIVLPGPALIVIPAGLAILATEFLWARRALRKCQGVVVSVKRTPWFRRFKRWRKSTHKDPDGRKRPPGKPALLPADPSVGRDDSDKP